MSRSPCLNRLLGHSEYHARGLILGNRFRSGIFHFLQPRDPVVSHSGHDLANRIGAGKARDESDRKEVVGPSRQPERWYSSMVGRRSSPHFLPRR